jgi:hypothetical protein
MMETDRRDFLRRMSSAAVLAAGVALNRSSNFGEALATPGLQSLRAQFPALAEKVNGHPLIYLDSAPTIPASLSSKDYFENRDPALQAVLEVVRSR